MTPIEESLARARAEHEKTRLDNLEILARIQARLEQEPSDFDRIDWRDTGTQTEVNSQLRAISEFLFGQGR